MLNCGLNNARTGVVVNIHLTSLNALCCASHTHWFPLTSRSWSGLVTSTRLGANLLIWFTVPRNLRISPTLVGTGILQIGFDSCFIHHLSQERHFTLFSVRPSVVDTRLWTNARRAPPGSFREWEHRQSDKQLLPDHRVFQTCDTEGVQVPPMWCQMAICWNRIRCYERCERDWLGGKGESARIWNWHRVFKHFGTSHIVWLTNGRGCRSLHTLSFSQVKSMQMCTWPLGLGTTTMPVHQSVGSLISIWLQASPYVWARLSLASWNTSGSSEGIWFCSL